MEVNNPSTFIRSDLDEVLFDALRAVYGLERDKIVTFDLTFEEIYILQFLRRRKKTCMSDIVAELRIPMSTASRIITRMQNRKLIIRKRDGGDRRNILVKLCRSGSTLVKRVEDHTYKIIMKNLSSYSPGEIESFYMTAKNLKSILSHNI